MSNTKTCQTAQVKYYINILYYIILSGSDFR